MDNQVTWSGLFFWSTEKYITWSGLLPHQKPSVWLEDLQHDPWAFSTGKNGGKCFGSHDALCFGSKSHDALLFLVNR